MSTVAVVPLAGPDAVAAARTDILDRVHRDGVVRLPGLVRTAGQLATVRDALTESPIGARERFAPRTPLGNGVYSALGWPDDRILCPQPEQSYVDTPPELLLLACLTPPTSGGEILVVDNRAALRALPTGLVDRARTEGWTLRRTFHRRIGLSWREAFEVDTPEEVAAYCRDHDIDLMELPGGALRTSQRRAAVRAHRETGDDCWANHLAFLNRWSLRADERQVLVSAFGVDALPLDTFLGADEPLEREVVDTINDRLTELTRPVRCDGGDVLVIDPTLTSTGRAPFTGPREVAVAFGA